jgi:outer membrane protein assembly factor BamB/actin-like ATPase involved in cell morphogenesis
MVEYGLGVDLGTTYTAAAINVGGDVETVRLGGREPEIPSVVFLRADGEVLVGDAAQRRGESEPTRLAREFKRRLGDPVPIMLAGTPMSAHALTARLLRHVTAAVAATQGGPPSRIVLTHPANWGPYKRELLMQAAQLADLPQATLRTEPEAAAVRYAGTARVAPGETIAVYDLGGGTFDAAVLRKTPGGFEVLGQPQGVEQLGGIDFDEAILEYVRGQLTDRLAGMDLTDPGVTEALSRLRRECVEAKENLSFDTDAEIGVALPRLHTRVRIRRSEFEALIAPALADTIEAVHRALRAAAVEPGDLRCILLAGGSSRIPLIGALVAESFGRPVAADEQPELGIALGAARFSSPEGELHEPAAAAPIAVPPQIAGIRPRRAGAAGRVASGAVPGGAVPGGAVPGGAVPGGAVPGGAVPGGAVPGGAVPGGAVPANAAPASAAGAGVAGASAAGAGVAGASAAGAGVAGAGVGDRGVGGSGAVGHDAAGAGAGATGDRAGFSGGRPGEPAVGGGGASGSLPKSEISGVASGRFSGAAHVAGAGGGPPAASGALPQQRVGAAGGGALPGPGGGFAPGRAVAGSPAGGSSVDSAGGFVPGGVPVDVTPLPADTRAGGWGSGEQGGGPRKRRSVKWPVLGGFAAVLVIVAAVTAVAVWPKGGDGGKPAGGGGPDGGSAGALASASVLWKSAAGAGTDEPPAVGAELVYVGGRDGVLRGYRRGDGQKAWELRLGEGLRVSSRVVGGVVYAVTGDGGVYAVDGSKGTELWHRNTGNPVAARAFVDSERVFVGGRDGVLYAYRIAEGHGRWRVWAAEISVPPTVIGDVVVVAGGDGVLRGVSSEGAELWKATVGDVSGGPVAAGDSACVVLKDGTARCVRSADGSLLPRISVEGTTLSGIDAADGVVFGVGANGAAGAWDATTGENRWLVPGAGTAGYPVVRGAEVDVTFAGGRVVGLDSGSGKALWENRIGDRFGVAAGGDEAGVFAVGDGGVLYALRPPGSATAVPLPSVTPAAPTTSVTVAPSRTRRTTQPATHRPTRTSPSYRPTETTTPPTTGPTSTDDGGVPTGFPDLGGNNGNGGKGNG